MRFLSIGASNEDEIERTVDVIRKYNSQPLCLLHCVLEYPTPYEHANLNKIVSLKDKYPNWFKNKYVKERPFKEKLLAYLFYKRKYKLIRKIQKMKGCFSNEN